MAQNAVEKFTLQHLLECIVLDLQPQEAAESGIAKGLVGVDKEVMKYGLVHRRAKTAYKKDERFLIVVPGKLFLFKGMDIAGKHVRFVTSLLGASTREELAGWIGAIEKSSVFANAASGESGRQNLQGARADKRRDLTHRNQENPGYTGRRQSESSSRDTRREYFDAGCHTNRSNDYDGRDQRRGNREYWNEEREKDQRNQVRDGYAGDGVESRGIREILRQDNNRKAMDNTNEFGHTSEPNMQLPRKSLEQGRERGQNEPFYSDRQDDRRLNGVSNYKELPGTSNQPVKPVGFVRRDYPDQRTMDNLQLKTRGLNGERDRKAGLESQKGRDYGRHEQLNAGNGAVYYAQSGFDRGNADYLSGNTRESKVWDGNYGPPVEARSANDEDEHRFSKSSNQSRMWSASVPAPFNQQLPAQTNLRDPAEWISGNNRGSKEDLDKMIFYMNLYRRGLIDSSTQT